MNPENRLYLKSMVEATESSSITPEEAQKVISRLKAGKLPQSSVSQIVSKLQAILKDCDHLRRAPWKGSSNPMAGHCYVASEALYALLGGPASPWGPQSISHEGSPHWYLKNKQTGEVVDPTASQFETPVPYDKGKGKGFLTKDPSKRALELLRRYFLNPVKGSEL